jgi:elongation factor Ts
MEAMTITAADVNKLRQQTGAGMMDCKKALVEANGDFDVATDLLRKKGQKVAAKRGDNETKEGYILAEISEDGKTGIVMTLNCETDFVAKNESYGAFVQEIMNIAMAKLPSTAEELIQLPYDDKLTVEQKIVEHVGVIGEKLVLSNYAKISGEKVVAYNHPGNQIATLVALNMNTDNVADAGRQVAMQVAAMAPLALNKDGISAETIERELEIGKELAIQEGKPAEMAEKIAAGRLNKFFQESTLLSQPFVRDNKLSVEQFLNSVEKGLTAVDFKRFSLS